MVPRRARARRVARGLAGRDVRGGACGADAHRIHARTPRRGRGIAVHGGGAAATRGRARDVAPAHSRPRSVACAPVPLHDSPKIANKLQNP
jgi:hypothetical protein